MKVDRRSFLGLGLGAVAGIAISPVGAKLTDDSSIWTQNWPWTPVPPDGKISHDQSVCTLCPGTCGISVRKIDSRPVKIEGEDTYPVNNGGACLHGIAGLQYLYDPCRVKTPLKKNNGRFEPISWQEALTLVAGRLGKIRENQGPDTLACITDTDLGSVPGLFSHFMTAFGSPNHVTMQTLESWLVQTAQTLHGSGRTLGFDLDNADFILSFGAGIIEGWGSPVACFKANSGRRQRGAKLYQIEPRLSNTAAKADRWIPIQPGTEADLAMAMCGILLQENLFDPEFAAGFRGGLNRFNAMVQQKYPVDQVAAVTGISAADIKKTAIAFAKAKMPVAVPGKGRGDGAQSLKEFAAIHTLNCLTGNINKKGGTFVKPVPGYLSFPDPVQDAVARKGAGKEKLAGSARELVTTIHQSDAPVVDTLFVYNANPCYSLNDPVKTRAAFDKIPFVVNFTSFMDETAMASDVILPISTFLERFEDVPSRAGLVRSVVGLARPVVDPVFDTRSPGDALILLAKTLGGTMADSFDWPDYKTCLKSLVPGIWKELSKNGHAVIAQGPPAGRVETNFAFLANNPPTMQPKGDANLTLVPIDNMRVATAVPASSPFAVKTVSDRVIKKKDMFVEINPKTANGLKDGGFVTVTTPAGSARVRLDFNEGIMPGVIGMVKGLGHGFDNKYVADKGVNVHELISPVIEPGSGLDAAFAVKASIAKA
ncbi:MAG TPA: menaquinone reductase molybdopterin-binding-like subunit QrcB [Desulfotignum sp.]|nr:menaquinone reductase molybdopterin-binding-like subunit QrcB [Desulfotignum sp.]